MYDGRRIVFVGFSDGRGSAGVNLNADLPAAPAVVLVAVKPQMMADALPTLQAMGNGETLFVSVAAGTTIGYFESVLGGDTPIVRAMPNTPCLVGEGMSVLSPGTHAQAADLDAAESLLAPLGRVLRLDEEHMDAVTGLSASGPAFVYLIIEALSEGGVMVGLPREVATELTTQTVLGAARMVQETGRHPASLKDDVTTPAGCTISALLALEDGRLRSVLARGVQEAARAASEL